ncbi:DUF3533 domain-containing protein [Leucobacter sp. CSA2]|uniref:DUF3533 domain-containing protein n=1 Tax=Leucobacter edaphi TaxID=2796472 RepID=A0A934QDT4_9MICO|nr:DUF3533 domain-containing protein [Leucobacter edaphi]
MLPLIYLSATVDPKGEMRDLPIAVVVEPQSVEGTIAAAEVVSDAIRDHLGEGFSIAEIAPDELAQEFAEDRIAGAAIIPANFDESMTSLSDPANSAPSTPTVRILTNAADGGLSGGLVSGSLAPLITAAGEQIGTKIAATAASLPPANKLLLAHPVHVEVGPYEALPDRSGLGTSAFYFGLVLLLVGFIGASVVHPLLDSVLGFIPTEVGPIVQRRSYIRLSRVRTLASKFVLMLLLAPLAAIIVQAVAATVGVATPQPLALWAFASATIAAIGVSALAVFAIFGSGLGSLANMLFFIALAMTSSGGTVPIAATPPLFRWLSTFEPFHPIMEGLRALFYFGENSPAGLDNAWIRIVIGGVVGLTLGFLFAAIYDKIPRFSRHPEPAIERVAVHN